MSFNHLNTSNGLSDNNVRCMAVDHNGFLWIGTVDGLNRYDGYGITTYTREKEPALASDYISDIYCDDQRHRLWIANFSGASWLDDNRRFHKVILNDTINSFECAGVLETKKTGVILVTDHGQYHLDTLTGKWNLLSWIPKELRYEKILDARKFSNNKAMFTTDSTVIILDYAAHKIVWKRSFFAPVSACKIDDDNIAVGIQTGHVQLINISTNSLTKEYYLTHELDGKPANTNLTDVQRTGKGALIVSTGYAGLIMIDTAGTITRYTHNALDPASLSANNIFKAMTFMNGDLFIATSTSGVNYGNIYNKQAGYTSVFRSASGGLFDNFIDDIVEDKKGYMWIGAYDRLIRWDRKNDQSKFFYFYRENNIQGIRNLEIRTLCFDKKDRLWIGTQGHGLAVFDEKTENFTKIPNDTSKGMAPLSNFIHDLFYGTDGSVWACSNTGFYTINPATLAITTFNNHPVLKEIADKKTVAIYEDHLGRIWFGVQNDGVYRYEKDKNKLIRFTEQDGLVFNTCYGFKEDHRGNMYMSSKIGFSIISADDSITSYTRRQGLRYDRCQGFLEDNAGNIWIANDKCLIKFNPQRRTMEFFDGNAGISVYGFRYDCCFKTSDGELYWGGQKGINYFYPDQLINNPAQLSVSIYQAGFHDSLECFIKNCNIRLPYNKNDIQFYFTAINLRGSRNILYQYMLEGYDKEWQMGTDIRQARYASLQPGNYSFKVKATIDRVNWVSSVNEVNVTIATPIWKRWWYIGANLSLVAGIIFWIISRRNKKIREQREEIETEQAINYFATSMYEQQTVESILWDVARNCIGRLKFEDCVIYLVDEEKNTLVQKAAHGPKSPRSMEIDKPIEISVGTGIVGSVARTGKAELIRDTTQDARYIVDDERRYSEISVPIISGGKVLGVIDCEHSKKGFFTKKHLSILTTIASLCANKITRAKAEEEKQKAQLILMDTQRKMTEIEMQALRAQMNPHFIFNCLNSINRYIVKSDQVTASLYLTRFAKLIRLILDNSNSRTVILTNELEALKLYIEMEALRFDKKFNYSINIDKGISTDNIEVPPLIIQPYVENAIWHGLLHKESDGRLDIYISMIDDNMLQCVIEDNGVGRIKSQELKSKSATSKKSLGTKLTENRLNLLNKSAAINASVDILDLYNGNGNARGTRIILKIPV